MELGAAVDVTIMLTTSMGYEELELTSFSFFMSCTLRSTFHNKITYIMVD
jgi:hypothetical protein